MTTTVFGKSVGSLSRWELIEAIVICAEEMRRRQTCHKECMEFAMFMGQTKDEILKVRREAIIESDLYR